MIITFLFLNSSNGLHVTYNKTKSFPMSYMSINHLLSPYVSYILFLIFLPILSTLPTLASLLFLPYSKKVPQGCYKFWNFSLEWQFPRTLHGLIYQFLHIFLHFNILWTFWLSYLKFWCFQSFNLNHHLNKQYCIHFIYCLIPKPKFKQLKKRDFFYIYFHGF